MKVGVFGSEYQNDKQYAIRRLFEKLSSLGATIYIDNKFYLFLTDVFNYEPPVDGVFESDCFDLDIALSIGGDGTFLRTAARINRQNIPILGINTGRLGFLADVGSTEIEDVLDELFKNYYRIEERTLLCLHTEQPLVKSYNFALNEIAVLKRDTSSMLTIHTFLNEDYLTSYQADGLIIATPTGSTAYSMSVNGPIIMPQNNSLVLTPVAPHSLNVRPLVIPDTYTINLSVESRNKSFLVSMDGRSEFAPSTVQLEIRKADYTMKVIKRYNHTCYEALRGKLMWGTDTRTEKTLPRSRK